MRFAGVSILVAALATAALQGTEQASIGARAAQPLDVSLVQLIAAPKEFNGKRVRVIGFCHLEFEGNGLYLHRQDFDQSISKNAVWLSVDQSTQGLSDNYVLVEGKFDAADTGHLGMFSGALTNVTRIERWRGRKEAD